MPLPMMNSVWSSGVTRVKEMLLPVMNRVWFLCEEGPCTNFLSAHVITCAPSVRSPSVTGRRMGGNNLSTLERICAECQGKMARFASAHKGLQLLQESHINTHILIHFIPSTQLHTALKHFKLYV